MIKLMTLIMLAIVTLVVSGCGTVLMKDCEQQGGSQYYHCHRVSVLH